MFYTILTTRILRGTRQQEMVFNHFQKLSSATNAISDWITNILKNNPDSRILIEQTEAFVHGKSKAIYGITIGNGGGNGMSAVLIENSFVDEEQQQPSTLCVVFGEKACSELPLPNQDAETPRPLSFEEAQKYISEKLHDAGSIAALSFNSEAEKRAYLSALEDLCGWNEYLIVQPEEIAFPTNPADIRKPSA